MLANAADDDPFCCQCKSQAAHIRDVLFGQSLSVVSQIVIGIGVAKQSVGEWRMLSIEKDGTKSISDAEWTRYFQAGHGSRKCWKRKANISSHGKAWKISGTRIEHPPGR